MTEPVILTQPQLEERLRYWQGVLRLQDWDIEVSIVPAHKMTNPDVFGELDPFKEKRHAYIRICDPAFCADTSRPWLDMERTLVHELLHVHLLEWKAADIVNLLKEQAIEVIVRALLTLGRRQQKPKTTYVDGPVIGGVTNRLP